MPNLKFTEVFVREMFEGIVDTQDVPMAEHMARVVEQVQDQDEHTQHIAWLHDIVEDTSTTLNHLTDLGYPYEVVEAVALLTHNKKEMTYPEYIDRLCNSGNLRAIRVKIADQIDNNNPKRWWGMNPYMARALSKKWAGVLPRLIAALEQA